jgi:hypothetical protein
VKIMSKFHHRVIDVVEQLWKIVAEVAGHRGIVPRCPSRYRGPFGYD